MFDYDTQATIYVNIASEFVHDYYGTVHKRKLNAIF